VTPPLRAAVGPRVRTSPFFDATVAAGLTAVSTYNHMWLPMSYGDPDAEYRRLTEAVALWDVAAQRHLEVRGPDADALVQLVTAVDVTTVPPGAGRYAPMTDHDGTLVNDPVVLRFDDGSWRLSISDGDVRLWIDALGRARGWRATVRELDTATLAVQGPSTPAVLAALGCGDLTSMPHLARRRDRIDGIDVWVSRSGWSHQEGAELFLDAPVPERALALWRAVAEAGRPFDIGPGAPNPSERIEDVLLSYGTDTGYDADPLEVGLGPLVDLDGPDFVGRDALRDVRHRGPRRQLLGAVIEGDRRPVLSRPAPLRLADRPVGELRAAAWSPRFTRNLGLALVEAGTPVGADGVAATPEGEQAVRLVALPFAEHLDR
jgi:aminomethyltransferase